MGLGGVRIARRICICREGLLVGGGLGGRKLGGRIWMFARFG